MLITAIPSVAFTVGANRIIRGVAIPYPVGAPSEESAEELYIRKCLLERALKALATPISEQTIFEE